MAGSWSTTAGAGIADRDRHAAGRGGGLRVRRSPTSPLAVRSTRRPAIRRPACVVCADVSDPGNAGTVIRCADAAGADAVVLAGYVGRPVQRQGRARVGRLAVPPAGRRRRRPWPRRSSPCRRAGLTVLAADGDRRHDLDDADRRGGWPARPPGCSATRRTGCRGECARWPTTSSRADLRPRREPQPGHGRRGLPLRLGARAAALTARRSS